MPIKRLYNYSRIVGIYPFMLTESGVKFTKLNIFQIIFVLSFWTFYYAQQFYYDLMTYKTEGLLLNHFFVNKKYSSINFFLFLRWDFEQKHSFLCKHLSIWSNDDPFHIQYCNES